MTDLQPGTRVALRADPVGVTLATPRGTVVGPSRWEGFCIVRLDVPGTYHRGDGTDEPIAVVVEAPDNLTVLTAGEELP